MRRKILSEEQRAVLLHCTISIVYRYSMLKDNFRRKIFSVGKDYPKNKERFYCTVMLSEDMLRWNIISVGRYFASENIIRRTKSGSTALNYCIVYRYSMLKDNFRRKIFSVGKYYPKNKERFYCTALLYCL